MPGTAKPATKASVMIDALSWRSIVFPLLLAVDIAHFVMAYRRRRVIPLFRGMRQVISIGADRDFCPHRRRTNGDPPIQGDEIGGPAR